MRRSSWRALVLAIGIAFAAIASVSCGSSVVVQNGAKESLYDRVIRTGKLRAAYVIAPAFCTKDPNSGKLSGIGVDALELVCKKLGLTVELPEEVGWATALEGIQTGRYDIIATPFWTNADRAKRADFSKPLCYSPIFAYVRKGDGRFKGHMERINSPEAKIATIDGETAQVIANAEFPRSRRLSLTQMTDLAQVLLSVSTGKADVAFQEPITAFQFRQNNPNSLEVLDANHPVRVFPNCWLFSRGEFEFKAMLDTVLDEVINSGAMDKIIDKYLPAPNLVYRVALPYQAPNSEHQKKARFYVASRNKASNH